MNSLNNREIATIIWVLIVLVFVLSKKPVRESLWEALKTFCNPKILLSVGLMIFYVAIVVAFLYAINFWNVNLLKDTIFWFCFTGMFLAINMVTSENEEHAFSKVLSSNLKVIIILLFLINSYTFPLLVELFIIPFGALIAATDVIAKGNKENAAVAKITTNLQAILGLVILVFAIYKTASDYGNFLTTNTLRAFFLAPILSFSFLPFIYLLVLFAKYEFIFVHLDFLLEKDEALKRYVKQRLVLHCKLKLKTLNKLIKSRELVKIRSREDLDKVLGGWHG